MENAADRLLWSKIISPGLRGLVPGVTIHLSGALVEGVAFEDCGELVWALVCISRAVEPELFDGFPHRREQLDLEAGRALIDGAVGSDRFHRFEPGALRRTLARLARNIEACAEGSPEREGHEMALERIEEVILYLAEQHPDGRAWIAASQQRGAGGPSARGSRGHLRLVR